MPPSPIPDVPTPWLHTDPPAFPQRVPTHPSRHVTFSESPDTIHFGFASTPASPTFSDDPPPSLQRVPDPVSVTTPTTDYHIFAVYNRDTAVSFIPDSGATHILIRDSDAHILHSTTTFPPHTRRPQFQVANRQFIVPTASGLMASRSPAPTSRYALSSSATMISRTISSALLPCFDTATRRKISFYTAPKRHTPTRGDFRCPARKTSAPPPSSATSSTPNRSCLLTPRSGHHLTPHFTTR